MSKVKDSTKVKEVKLTKKQQAAELQNKIEALITAVTNLTAALREVYDLIDNAQAEVWADEQLKKMNKDKEGD